MQTVLLHRRLSFVALLLGGALLVYLATQHFKSRCMKTLKNTEWPHRPVPLPPDDHPKAAHKQSIDHNSPLIFIGGVPGSGLTLISAMLDAHPLVRCSEESLVIRRILATSAQWTSNFKEARRLDEAGVTDDVLKAAISAFIVQVIAGHGEPADRLCNKDQFALKSTQYLSEIFPNSKFVLVIRDGRATVHSIISRKMIVEGFDLRDRRQCLEMWNEAIENMYSQCDSVGSERCFMIYYEELLLHPEKQMRELLAFLDLPWHSSVLNRKAFIGIGKDISVEIGTDQVMKPANLDALNEWVGQFPEDIINEMANIAPMLDQLGYDPEANPPNYGKLEDVVVGKMSDAHKHGIKLSNKAVRFMADPFHLDGPSIR